MAFEFGFFDSINGDRPYGSIDITRYMQGFIGNGFFPNPSTQLQAIADGNADIIIKPGKCWINGFFFRNTADYIQAVPAGHAQYQRIDAIFITLTEDVSIRNMDLVYIQGSPAPSPLVPPPPAGITDYLTICTILIEAQSSGVSQSSITDMRHEISSIIDTIDTSTVYAQLTDAFNIWFQAMKDQLSTDAAGHLQEEIDNLAADITITLPASGWVSKVQTFADPVFTPTNTKDIDWNALSASMAIQCFDAQFIFDETTPGQLTITCAGTQPTIDLSLPCHVSP
jgi:hypothetical protein